MLVISDVHIGSKFFLCEPFVRFLDALPAGVDLVLNGDTIDSARRRLLPCQQQALDRLAAEASRRRIVWIDGNHDEGYRLPGAPDIEYRPNLAVGKRLFVAHGFYFDHVMPYHRMFVLAFRALHRIRLWLGAERVHVAHYAKRWPILYNVLLRSVRVHAIRFAKEHGFDAVACGHTHYPEERMIDGIRFFNTGSWTERPMYCLDLDDTGIRMLQIVEREGPGGAIELRTAATDIMASAMRR